MSEWMSGVWKQKHATSAPSRLRHSANKSEGSSVKFVFTSNTSSCQRPSGMKQAERERERVDCKSWWQNYGNELHEKGGSRDTWCYSLPSRKFPSKFSAVGTKYAQETPRSNTIQPLKMTILKFRLHQRKTDRSCNAAFHISFFYDTQNIPSS
jgi:hypothetical protein